MIFGSLPRKQALPESDLHVERQRELNGEAPPPRSLSTDEPSAVKPLHRRAFRREALPRRSLRRKASPPPSPPREAQPPPCPLSCAYTMRLGGNAMLVDAEHAFDPSYSLM
ncbi:hypothetical protein ACS0TY_023272 [Phlomoides rotata]